MRTNRCLTCSVAQTCLPKQINLSIPHLESLFRFHAKLLKKGEHLCYQGEISETLYIVRSGALKSYLIKPNGEEFIMGFHFPSDLFGFEGNDHKQRSLGIVALEPSNICVISYEKIQSIIQKIPEIHSRFIRMINHRIHQDNVALLRTSANQRIATFLLELAFRYAHLGYHENALYLAMSHQDIANYLRMTANTLSRIFHEWQTHRLIDIRKHTVYLRDLEGIKRIADS